MDPTKAGKPISRLDKRDAVVDTGTQADETGPFAETVIRWIRRRPWIGESKACPAAYGVSVYVSGKSGHIMSYSSPGRFWETLFDSSLSSSNFSLRVLLEEGV